MTTGMAYSNIFTNDEVKHRILNVYANFVSDVEPDPLCDWLVQENVITIDQKQRIRYENPIALDRCRAILDHLFSIKHPRAFLVVRQALVKENHYLLEEIDSQKPEPGIRMQTEEQSALLDSFTNDEVKHRILKIYAKFVSDVEPDRLFDWLVQEHVITIDQKKKIYHVNPIASDRCRAILDHLFSLKHPRAFLVVRKALVKDNHYLLEEIDIQNPGNVSIRAQPASPDGRECDESAMTNLYLLRYRPTSEPVLVQTIRTKAAEDGRKEISGLTILDKELFVVSNESSKVEVYDSIKLSFIRRWKLKELIDPLDIGSCNRNKCLYIIDYKGNRQSSEILRVDSKGKLIKKWLVGNIWGLLSVTDESNVILADYYAYKLKEYSPDGQLIHNISLSSDTGIRYPRHAIKLTNGLFVVSHGHHNAGGGRGSDDSQRVCLVDADGKLLTSFGGERGSTIGQLNNPIYLFVDGNGIIMVADRGNSRVLLLDSNLQFKREILSEEKHGLQYPSRILLDESKGRLFVADNDWNAKKKSYVNGQFLIFDF